MFRTTSRKAQEAAEATAAAAAHAEAERAAAEAAHWEDLERRRAQARRDAQARLNEALGLSRDA